MSIWFLVLIALVYLGILTLIALWAEKRSKRKNSLLQQPWIYSLSLAVFCTAWTFYGSVGRVIDSGIDFITIYIGPLLGSILLWYVLRKMIRICEQQKINSLADFLSNRYGKNISIGVLVSVFSVIGIIPYISLQIKSINESLAVLTGDDTLSIGQFNLDTGFLFAAALAAFTVLFGLRKIDLTEKHEGIVVAIAFESVVKVVALLVIGIFAYLKIQDTGGIAHHADVLPKTDINEFHWVSMIILSLFAFFLLPRQFQMMITENVNERHLKSAAWQFPLYLLIINLFVLPIALSGNYFLGSEVNPDYYVLELPLSFGNNALSVVGFFGGFAAASGMIVVSTISLATMLSNNILLPFYFKINTNRKPQSFKKLVALVRRTSVFAIAILAYIYYEFIALNNSLVSIGLISFAAVAQFAPATFGALFWKQANRKGAFMGTLVGAIFWAYIFILPSVIDAGFLGEQAKGLLVSGRFLNPNQLFGIQMPSHISGGLFWSLLFNTIVFIGLSVFRDRSSSELNQAELFVDVFKYPTYIEENLYWRGVAKNKDLKQLLNSFLPRSKAYQAIRIFETRYNAGKMIDDDIADRKFVTYTENVLTGIIGISSARIMVSSISKEEEIKMDDVMSILRESKEIMELNRQLQYASEKLQLSSEQLKEANDLLRKQDELKNEFLYTVTHEIRTPLTSIRAFTEIIRDTEDLNEEDKGQFIGIMSVELERLSRLISQVLDLEKYESGKYSLNLSLESINELLDESIQACNAQISNRNITLDLHMQSSIQKIYVDRDKLKQVFINLISNAAKYSPPEGGVIKVSTYFVDDTIRINIKDNGDGISVRESEEVFNKFYQIQNQQKQKGNGLGLAISKEIINLHQGSIWLDTDYTDGAKFCISLPNRLKHEKDTDS